MTGTSTTKQAVRDFFEALAPRRAAYVRRRHAYYDDLNRFLQCTLHPDISVIEIGSGVGNVLQRLPQRKKTGIDFAPAMVAQAKTLDTTGTNYLVDDIEELQHKEKYDAVLLLDTINSLNDVQVALTNIRNSLCTDDSRLVITFHNFVWKPLLTLASALRLKTPAPAQNWLSRGDIASLLLLADFEMVTSGERFLWPWATPLIAPLFNRFLVKLPLIRHLALSQYVIARPLPRSRRDGSVSIVIPARNEAGNMQRAIDTIPSFGTSLELIFVEGHSKDNTWQTIQDLKRDYKGPHKMQIMQQEGKGKGDAVRKGFAAATGDILMILDADLTVDPSDLPKFYEAIASGKGDFINGSRLVYPMDDKAMRFLNLLGNKLFSLMFTWLLGQTTKDTLCGTKVLRRSDYENIARGRSYFGDFDPFGDFDLLFGASKLNMKILEVPIRYKERTYGTTNIRRFRDGILLFRMCAVAAKRLKFI